MKVKFVNGITKECNAPTEQKIFRTAGGESVGSGWVLQLRLSGGITSAELDELVTVDNIASLEFFAENDAGEDVELFVLSEYNKITSSIIRHSEATATTYTDIQLSKGV